jgi:beta-mannosidase
MLSRATQADVMRHVFTEWMRAGSPTHGGLILMLQDLQPGAGWGILTSDGRPKSPWYALKRQFRPVSVTMTDEGVNGLDIHLGNEMNREIPATLQLVALRHGHVTVLSAQHAVTLAARSRQTLAAFDIMGRFFDLTYAYRFGPAEHDAVVARLSDAEGRLLGETVHFPLGHRGAIPHAQITAEVRHDDGGWRLELAAQRLARFVHIVDDHFLPDDDWFHLVPGHANTVRLRPRGRDGGAAQVPRGVVRAINLATPVAYKVVS